MPLVSTQYLFSCASRNVERTEELKEERMKRKKREQRDRAGQSERSLLTVRQMRAEV